MALLWVDPIKAQYRRVNHKGSAVDFNDAFFSLHAVVLTIVTLFQILIYDRGSQKVDRGQRPATGDPQQPLTPLTTRLHRCPHSARA